MFTGLVENTASIEWLTRRGTDARLRVSTVLDAPLLGESISVDGVCLTVAQFDARGFEADVSEESLAVTTLGALRTGSLVNLERATKLGERMGGHIVSGHVDGVATIVSSDPVGQGRKLTVEAQVDLLRFLAPKGSVTLNGVSLTINRVFTSHARGAGDDFCFELLLVPHTLERTNFGQLKARDAINIEVDVLARYVAWQLTCTETMHATPSSNHASSNHASLNSGLSSNASFMDTLHKAGFMSTE